MVLTETMIMWWDNVLNVFILSSDYNNAHAILDNISFVYILF